MANLSHAWPVLALMLATSGCGWPDAPSEAPVIVRSLTESASSVLHATQGEVDAGTALPLSYLVMFRSETGGPGLAFADIRHEARSHVSWLEGSYLADPRVARLHFITSVDLSASPDGSVSSAEAAFDPPYALKLAWSKRRTPAIVGSLAQVDFASREEARSALAEWERRGALWYAEPNYISRTSADEPQSHFGKLAEKYGGYNYWWLKAINLPQAFESIAARDLSVEGTPTDEAILAERPLVAVLDSGVDYEHPALKDRIWINTDVNASGCEDDLHGCNTTTAKRGRLGDGDVWPYDADGPNQSCFGKDNNCTHGTHVAGIIAGDNAWNDPELGRPAAGVCPVCRIMILKIVSKVGKDSGILDSAILSAFKYVTLIKREGSPAVRVINASFGKFVRSRSVGLLIRVMKERTGTVVVSAAGNEDTLTMEYPAAFKDSIAVAAVDSRLNKVSFSNFGRWVDVSAPGAGILSTVPGAGLDAKSGTSMAAPIVAGVAGLLLARYPDASFDDIRTWLLEGADPTFYESSHEEGLNYQYYYRYPGLRESDGPQPLLGYGVVNANSAINRTPTLGLPVFPKNDRVRPGCAVVGTRGFALAVTLLLLPFTLFVIPRPRTSRRESARVGS